MAALLTMQNMSSNGCFHNVGFQERFRESFLHCSSEDILTGNCHEEGQGNNFMTRLTTNKTEVLSQSGLAGIFLTIFGHF